MTLFAHGSGAVRDSYASPVLSPTNWSRNNRKPLFADGLDNSGSSWLPPMKRYNDNPILNLEPVQPWNNHLDTLGKPSDGLYGSTPDLRALRSRIIDSPGYASGLDVPAYLRSVDNKRYSYTPKRIETFARRSVSPRRHSDILNNHTSFNFKSPLLLRNSKVKRSNRVTLPELRIGTYVPSVNGALSTNTLSRYGRNIDQLDIQNTPQSKSRINIHATDDILNRIKRSLSECENITKRLDRQYGSRRSQPAITDYSERVFPRALADNLFTNNAPIYRNGLNLKSNIETVSDEFKKPVLQDHERPKGALSRILDNIKRIRNRTLFSDIEESSGKRNFVEVEKDIDSPKLSRRPRTLDVDAIQQRIKQQKRTLLSQRTSTRYD
ncbi:genome-derived neisseria antigen, putative [Babesia ovis]|uniref:Genome-derived neisseria antigen, putative n=1 Tax=Babesia ovis TaxID=5869 RepID=A0A9W5WV88_BABOV|nr:genome-derived neisseria antigen, putative [Babesia ovis]